MEYIKPWKGYTDGAYNHKFSKHVAGGFILFDDEGNRCEYANCIENEMLSASRNVGAEILGAWYAVWAASKLGCKKLILFHDYIGISEWVLGYWSAKTELSRIYVDEMRKFQDGMKIIFKHVKAHSSNYWNNMVDSLVEKKMMEVIQKVKAQQVYAENVRIIQERIDRDAEYERRTQSTVNK